MGVRVSFYDLVLWLHVTAVVAAFGALFATLALIVVAIFFMSVKPFA